MTYCIFYSQVWLHAPYELHLSLFEHFIELLTESRLVSKDYYGFSWLRVLENSS